MSAVLSDDGVYRYALWREWTHDTLLTEFHCPIMGGVFTANDGSPDACHFEQDETCLFVMLNPSTADADEDDPTIRRCVGFAKRWGFGKLAVANLFAYRATDPRRLASAEVDPVGPENDDWICRLANEASFAVVAWGASFPVNHERVREVLFMLDHDYSVVSLGITAEGHPRHPLYVSAATPPVPFQEAHYRQVYA